MLNLKISKRQASPAVVRLSRQSARFEDLLRRTDKDALTLTHEVAPRSRISPFRFRDTGLVGCTAQESKEFEL